MQRAVCNLLKNHSFENTSDWTLSPSMSYATDSKYMGNRSLKVTTQGVTGMHTAAQSVLIERGKTYTFSFYARKSGDIDVWAYYAYTNSVGQIQYVHAPSMKPQLTDTFGRLTYTFTVPANAANSYITVAICAGADNGVYATAWFDCAQLEESAVANRYNILENGDFTFNSGAQPISWQKNSGNTAQDIVYTTFDGVKPAGLSANTMRIYGEGRTKYAGIYQDMPLSGAAGDVFVAGGWSMNHSMPIEGEPYRYGIRVAFLQAGTSTRVNTPAIEWSEEWSDWQFAAGPVIAPVNYSAVRFNVDYERNINYTEFDGFFFNKEEFGTSFAYDSKGNILSSQDLAGLKDHAVYDAFNNMTSYRQPGRPSSVQTVMEYGTTDTQKKKHLLLKSTSPHGTIRELTYMPQGVLNVTATKSNSSVAFMQTANVYYENCNYQGGFIDERGKASTTDYNTILGTINVSRNPLGQEVEYTYDLLRRVTSATLYASGRTYLSEYAYTGENLTTIKHNTGEFTSTDVIYYFSYDALGSPSTVKVGSQMLSTNVYTNSGDKLLIREEYGNGGKVSYSRDSFKRITGTRFDAEASDRYQFDYDATGILARIRDNNLNRTIVHEVDAADRPSRTTQIDGSGWNLHTSVLSYDAYNNISRFEEQLGYWRNKYPTDFLYDNENRPISLRYNGTVNRTDYTYDALARVSNRNAVLNNISYLSSYGYVAGGHGANSTSSLIESITQSGHNLYYTYDDNDNILSTIYKGQSIGYVYDPIGQLVRVNDQINNESWTYEYDRGGNILVKKRYSYNTGTLGAANHTEEYQYGDTNWQDKMTARVINGVVYPIVSDAIGNITSYAGWTYAWQAGRQLASQTNSSGVVEYKYNADGIRVQKKRGSAVTDYVLSGKNIVHMTITGSHTLHFYYDAQNKPAQVQYNGTMYRYVHNLQGDIIAILDASGNTVVQYAYDPWGRKKTTTGSMASTLGLYNPFRYRGYVYDEETSMYYLRSRYYYPELQRFISADAFADNCSVFAYCHNSPISRFDEDGCIDNLAIMREKTPLHNLVASMVAVQVGGYTTRDKTRIMGAGPYGGPGYPDVIAGIEVWEIKPDTEYGWRTGPVQMGRYANERIGYQPGRPVFIPEFTYYRGGVEGTVKVRNGDEKTKDRGVVYYDWNPKKREAHKQSVTVPATKPIPKKQTNKALGLSPGLAFLALIGALLLPGPDELLWLPLLVVR